jgi:hypothetical protein
VIPIAEGHAEKHPAARPESAITIPDKNIRVLHMFQDFRMEDEVKAFVFYRKSIPPIIDNAFPLAGKLGGYCMVDSSVGGVFNQKSIGRVAAAHFQDRTRCVAEIASDGIVNGSEPKVHQCSSDQGPPREIPDGAGSLSGKRDFAFIHFSDR